MRYPFSETAHQAGYDAVRIHMLCGGKALQRNQDLVLFLLGYRGFIEDKVIHYGDSPALPLCV